jgi:hypothetical protein
MIGVKVVPTSRGWWGDGGRDLLFGEERFLCTTVYDTETA